MVHRDFYYITLVLWLYILAMLSTSNVPIKIFIKESESVSLLKYININQISHLSHIPSENIEINKTIHEQHLPFPNIGELYDYDGSLVTNYENHTWLHVWNLSYQYILMKNVYFTTLNGFATWKYSTAYTLDEWFSKDKWYIDNGTYELDKVFHDVVAITAPFGYGYGDFLLGTLTRLARCPVDVLNKSDIIITGAGRFKHHALALLNALGISNPSFVLLDNQRNHFINFAFNLHTILPNFLDGSDCRVGVRDIHHSVYGPFGSKLGTIMRSYFQIDDKEPIYYLVYNRPSNEKRTISNIHEIMDILAQNFSQYNFTLTEGIIKTAKETVTTFGMAKWLFSVTGSNLLNCFYMRRKSGALVFMPKSNDHCFPNILATRELFFVIFKDQREKMYGAPVRVDPIMFVKYANRSLQIYHQQHL